MHGEDDADEDDDDEDDDDTDDDDDDDDDDDAFVAYLIWTLVLMLGDLHSGTLFFDPRFRGDPVHLLLHLRVTSVFFFLLFLRILPINNNNHHHNVYLVPRILETTFNTTSTIKAHWGSAASGVSLLNNGFRVLLRSWVNITLNLRRGDTKGRGFEYHSGAHGAQQLDYVKRQCPFREKGKYLLTQ